MDDPFGCFVGKPVLHPGRPGALLVAIKDSIDIAGQPTGAGRAAAGRSGRHQGHDRRGRAAARQRQPDLDGRTAAPDGRARRGPAAGSRHCPARQDPYGRGGAGCQRRQPASRPHPEPACRRLQSGRVQQRQRREPSRPHPTGHRVGLQRTAAAPVQIERADGCAGDGHRQREQGLDAVAEDGLGERWPAVLTGAVQVWHQDRPALRDGVKEFSSWPTVPQLYVKGEFVGGCDIVIEMQASGELDRELKAAGLVQGEVDGPRVCYCLDPAGWATARQLLSSLLAELPAPMTAPDGCC